jgi:hypothetical protein
MALYCILYSANDLKNIISAVTVLISFYFGEVKFSTSTGALEPELHNFNNGPAPPGKLRQTKLSKLQRLQNNVL